MSGSAAVNVSRNYFQAWSGGDFEHAMTFIDPNILCHTPAGPIQGAEAFHGFMGPFAGMVTDTSLLASFGDTDTAVLMYDTVTPLVEHAPGAEWHRVANGRVVEMRIIFDRLPFDLALRTVEQA
ncbi:MAG: nuclear transport factor 2 family protein [Mycobacterium sp.]|nr:nuclear transport factor 2 family protein [Mycobacterium sp.]